jgi:hypothetical protein
MSHKVSSSRRQQNMLDVIDFKEYKKGQSKSDVDKPKLTYEQQIKKYYIKSLYNYGFLKSDVNTIMTSFFKDNNNDDNDDTNDNNDNNENDDSNYNVSDCENSNDEESDSSESFLKEVLKQRNKGHQKTIVTSSSISDLDRDEIMAGLILLLIDINKWFFKNKEIEKELDGKIQDSIKDFRGRLNEFPNMFSIPKTSNLPNEFLTIFSNLGLVPQHFNLTSDELGDFMNNHITALNDIGVFTIEYSPSIIMMASNPAKRQIAICHNKLLNVNQSKQKLTAFIIGCSMVSKPPNKIEFLPSKFVETCAKVYPTIGSCVKAFNSKKGVSSLQIFDEWAKSELGKTLIGSEDFKPTDKAIKYLFEISWRVYSALYNTMTNRNCFSKTHVFTDDSGKKIIFPFMPVDFVKQISYSFPVSLFKSTVDEMSDHRFISTTFMMSMIMSLLIISVTNPNNDIYRYYNWIDHAIEDYHSHIIPIKGETKESKNERIAVANKALYEVIEYLNQIVEKANIEVILTKDENKLMNAFFDGIYNLFPENKKDDIKGVKKNKGESEDKSNTTNNKGTDQYYSNFPDFTVDPPLSKKVVNSVAINQDNVWNKLKA